MSNMCKNCNSETTDLFCAHCGQPTSTNRINWTFCIKEYIFNNFTLHKGMLFTIKSLILHPKKVVEDYLKGKRISYTGAIQFFLFILIFKGLISLLIGDAGATEPGNITINGVSSEIDFVKYMKPMVLIYTAFSSIGNYLVFKNRKYNLAEHFVLNFYIVGMGFFLGVVFNLVSLYRFKDFDVLFMTAVVLSYYIRIFYDKKIRGVDVLKGIWCLTINLFFALILVIIGAIIYMYQHNLFDTAIQIS